MAVAAAVVVVVVDLVVDLVAVVEAEAHAGSGFLVLRHPLR
jgi:hypothetical protein